MQKIKGMKETLSCPLFYMCLMLSWRNVPIFILNLIYKLCWMIVQRVSMRSA